MYGEEIEWSEEEEEEDEDDFPALPVPGKFMTLDRIVKILLGDEERVYPRVPKGAKRDVYFVVEDSENALVRDAQQAVTYIDDYDRWLKVRNCRTSYAQFIGGKITPLDYRKELFCVFSKTEGRYEKVPLNPQPDPKSLVRISRYQFKLEDGLNKRITAVSGIGFKDRSLFEYCDLSRKRVKTVKDLKLPPPLPLPPPKVEECDVSDGGGSGSDSEVDRDDNPQPHRPQQHGRPDRSEETQRHFRQHKQHKLNNSEVMRELRPASPITARNTDADADADTPSKVHREDLDMILMLEQNPRVQAVMHKKKELPSVILYDDTQLSDMKRNLECGSVMGIDCSYKIGDCYATMVVFQNSMALHKDTNEPLLYLGPVYLHWDEEISTYVSFFSHIVDRLDGFEANLEVRLGDDMDLFVLDALNHCFPTSLKLVNPYHLRDLVDRDLRDIMPGCLQARSEIMQKVFGYKGVVSSPSSSIFESRVEEVTFNYREFSGLVTYLDKLKGILYPYVCMPQMRGVLPELWTNRHDELLTNLLHRHMKHRTHKIPKIVEQVCEIMSLQTEYLDNLNEMQRNDMPWEL